MLRRLGRVAAGLTALVALTSAPSAAASEGGSERARAGDAQRVLVVGGGAAPVRAADPFLPERAARRLGREPRSPALASSARAPRASGARRGRDARKLRFGKRGRRAVVRAIRSERRAKRISRRQARRFRRIYSRARPRARRLRGARGRELRGVVDTLEAIASRRGLSATRMPALFLILRRNAQFWPRSPFPSSGGMVRFRGSEMLFEYYPGRGLQLQPLVNFKQANNMHGACVKDTGERCDRAGLGRLLRELVRTSSWRGGFRTWEYYFEFGGGRPPWISGMAQATAIQAFGRASQIERSAGYRRYARESMPAFERRAPTGVLTDGPLGGPHYLQYSFAPRLYITNALLQTVIGLFDYAAITGDKRADRLWRTVEAEARRELQASDTGRYSTYSYRGNESTAEYHELLREFAASLCSRLRTATYCTIAERYQRYSRRRGG
jgi:hypothetical protein